MSVLQKQQLPSPRDAPHPVTGARQHGDLLLQVGFSTTGFEHIIHVCAKHVLKQRAYVTENVEMAYVSQSLAPDSAVLNKSFRHERQRDTEL